MLKIASTTFASVFLMALPMKALEADAPVDNPGQPFEQLEEKLDTLGEQIDTMEGKIDALSAQVDELMPKLDFLESGLGLIEAKLDTEVESCPTVPNLQAAITKQIEQLDPPPGYCTVLVELITLTNQPFQPQATNVVTPVGVDLQAGFPTTSCTTTINGDYRCAHTAVFQYPTGMAASGDYSLGLQYQCVPEVEECELCDDTEIINFTLATTACSTTDIPGG